MNRRGFFASLIAIPAMLRAPIRVMSPDAFDALMAAQLREYYSNTAALGFCVCDECTEPVIRLFAKASINPTTGPPRYYNGQ